MGPDFSDWCFGKRKEKDSDRKTETEGQEGILRTEAYIGGMQPQGKKHQGHEKLGKIKEGFFSRAFQESMAFWYFDVGTLASRTLKE